MLQSVLNKPMFLKATHHIRRNKETCSTEVSGGGGLRGGEAGARAIRIQPSTTLKNNPRILPVRRSLLAPVGKKRNVVVEISSPLKNHPVRPFDCRAQGFSTPPPLARR